MTVLKKHLKLNLCPILRWTLPKTTAELYHFHARTSVLTKRLQAARKSNSTMFLLLTKLPCLMARNGRRKKYAVAGDILDGNLYDLFMGMLDERGIDKQFAERLSTYCSAYEHGLYIKMLQDLQKFAK